MKVHDIKNEYYMCGKREDLGLIQTVFSLTITLYLDETIFDSMQISTYASTGAD